MSLSRRAYRISRPPANIAGKGKRLSVRLLGVARIGSCGGREWRAAAAALKQEYVNEETVRPLHIPSGLAFTNILPSIVFAHTRDGIADETKALS